jgi:3-hydroxymyristoyl/3-hydroxydecanoyl-(acyl carrier protein) dehydratase
VNPDREELPHVYPFRFVERTVEKRGPSQGRVRALVTGNGRRTGADGFLPPLTLVEVVAQSALLLEGGDPGIGRSGFLAGVSDFTFDRTPESGDLLNVDVRIVGVLGPIVKFEGTVTDAEGRRVCTGAVTVRKGGAA